MDGQIGMIGRTTLKYCFGVHSQCLCDPKKRLFLDAICAYFDMVYYASGINCNE